MLDQASTNFIEEIAAVVGLTRSAIKSRHVRALVRLRALLGDYLVEDQP